MEQTTKENCPCAVKKTVYDTTKFAERMYGLWSLDCLKQTMLKAIGNIAVAVHDKDAERAMKIQCDLLWVLEVFSTIEEKEVIV